MSQKSNCDHCDQQMNCRNLYVALKILDEELRWAHRLDLLLRYQDLKREIEASGYSYPDGGECSLSGHSKEAKKFVETARTLLKDLRKTIKIVDL